MFKTYLRGQKRYHKGELNLANKSECKHFKLKLVILSGICIVCFFATFLIGRYNIEPITVIKIIASQFFSITPSWSSMEESVVMNIRLPRVLCAALVGAALSTAGASYQGLFQNPMASPDIMGASSGAGFGAALGIFFAFNYFGIAFSAFCFGIVAVAAAVLISRISKRSSILSLVLAGIMISSLFSSGTSFIKLIADTDSTLPAITYWLMGSLSSVSMRDVKFIIMPMILGFIPIFALRWRMNLLTVGEDEAKSMGVNTTALRAIIIVCATLITAASVSVSGMVGFVGLIVPHFCRRAFGYDFKKIIPTSMLAGASFLMIVDTVSRCAATSEIPLGILTSLIGAPVLLYMIAVGGERHEY